MIGEVILNLFTKQKFILKILQYLKNLVLQSIKRELLNILKPVKRRRRIKKIIRSKNYQKRRKKPGISGLMGLLVFPVHLIMF